MSPEEAYLLPFHEHIKKSLELGATPNHIAYMLYHKVDRSQIRDPEAEQAYVNKLTALIEKMRGKE